MGASKGVAEKLCAVVFLGSAKLTERIRGATWRGGGARRLHGLTKTKSAGRRTLRNQTEDKQVLARSRREEKRGWRITHPRHVPVP